MSHWTRIGVTTTVGIIASAVLVTPALGATGGTGASSDLIFATSEIAQVLLSIAAVSFAVLAARAYGGEIGKAIYIASGGVIVFGTWQLVSAMSRLLELQQPPVRIGSTVNLFVTVLLLAGFYMLYETITGHTAA